MRGEEITGEQDASKILYELRKYYGVAYSKKPLSGAFKRNQIFFMSEVDLAINNDNSRLKDIIKECQK